MLITSKDVLMFCPVLREHMKTSVTSVILLIYVALKTLVCQQYYLSICLYMSPVLSILEPREEGDTILFPNRVIL